MREMLVCYSQAQVGRRCLKQVDSCFRTTLSECHRLQDSEDTRVSTLDRWGTRGLAFESVLRGKKFEVLDALARIRVRAMQSK